MCSPGVAGQRTWLVPEPPYHRYRARQSARAGALSRASALPPRAAAFFARSGRAAARLVWAVLGAWNRFLPTQRHRQLSPKTPRRQQLLRLPVHRHGRLAMRPRRPNASACELPLQVTASPATQAEHRTQYADHAPGGSRHRLSHRTDRQPVVRTFWAERCYGLLTRPSQKQLACKHERAHCGPTNLSTVLSRAIYFEHFRLRRRESGGAGGTVLVTRQGRPAKFRMLQADPLYTLGELASGAGEQDQRRTEKRDREAERHAVRWGLYICTQRHSTARLRFGLRCIRHRRTWLRARRPSDQTQMRVR